MHAELLSIGNFTLYSYGLMVALAFVAGIVTALLVGKRDGLSAEIVLDAVLWVMISAILGARVFYLIEYSAEFASPLEAFMIWRGGLVFYGGLIFSVIALVLFGIKNKLSIFRILDIAAPSAAIGYAIGRIGCFLNGCCYGVASELPWAVKFPNLIQPRHPTQLYASFAGVLIFIVLLFLFKYRRFEGQIFCFGLMLYSIYRFLNEFLRINPRYILGLSEAQIISIGLFIFGIILYGVLNNRAGKGSAS
ncbi:MAG: prolipoprotein diacylglyceryl transferase [Candidatus Saganbacteria bacterium]|nr:prolipoprotein diacylglyceryl transferase [Candidatus Saganbacteria bacterium]